MEGSDATVKPQVLQREIFRRVCADERNSIRKTRSKSDKRAGVGELSPPPCIVSVMDKKQINSPKLTANFLVWIGLFLLAMFLLIAHFVWRIF